MWLTSLLPGRSFDLLRHGTRLSHRRPTPRRRSAAPRLEVMEDRTVLSTLTVMNINDSGPGSLRQAILDANSNGSTTNTINFAPALAGQTITLTSGELKITKSVNIVGTSTNGETISGNNSSRVFEFASGTSTISGLGITNGNSASSSLGGGGILNEANLTVDGVISGNSATKGGGIENAGGTLTVSGVISGNSATKGGGIENAGGTLTVSGLISDNTASTQGGGIENAGGTLTVSNGDISDNTASTQGGGIDNTNAGTVMIVNGGTVMRNSATKGGGIENAGGTLTVNDGDIIFNTASTQGGGIDNTSAGTVMIVNGSTVWGNTAPVGPDINGPFTAHNSMVGGIDYP